MMRTLSAPRQLRLSRLQHEPSARSVDLYGRGRRANRQSAWLGPELVQKVLVSRVGPGLSELAVADVPDMDHRDVNGHGPSLGGHLCHRVLVGGQQVSEWSMG